MLDVFTVLLMRVPSGRGCLLLASCCEIRLSGVHALGFHYVSLHVDQLLLNAFHACYAHRVCLFLLATFSYYVMLVLCFSDYLHFSITDFISSTYGSLFINLPCFLSWSLLSVWQLVSVTTEFLGSTLLLETTYWWSCCSVHRVSRALLCFLLLAI